MSFCSDLTAVLSLRYVLDRDWVVLAVHRGDAPGDDRALVGRDILSFVSDRSLRELLGQVFRRVHRSARSLNLAYRCDTPELRRFCVMHIEPSRGEGLACLEVENRTMVAERREEMPILDPAVERGEEIVTVCSWCKKIRVADHEWCEVEVGVDRLKLMTCIRLPRLSHGICPPCTEYVLSEANRQIGSD